MEYKQTQGIHTLLLLIIAGLLAVGLMTTRHIALDVDMSQQNNNTITVTGVAERELVPDTARISFRVTRRSPNQSDAADYVNRKTKTVVHALMDLGIAEKDIKTSQYSLHPEYNWKDGTRTFVAYRASQGVTVTVHNLEKTSDILQKIAELHVDNINGPNMFIENREHILDGLRAQAIQDAKAKAQALASDLGVKIQKIVGFSEGGNKNIGYIPMMAKAEFATEDMRSIEAPEINPGTEKVKKTVTITYKIEN